MRSIRVACLWLVLLIRTGSCSGGGDLLRAIIMGSYSNEEVATHGTNETALTSSTVSSIRTSHVTSLVTSPPTSTTSVPTTSVSTTSVPSTAKTALGEMMSHALTKCFDLHCYYRGCLRNETNATDAGECTTASPNPCFVTFVGSDTYTRVTAGCNNGRIVCDNIYRGEGNYLRWTKCCSTNHCNDNENYVYQAHGIAGRLTSLPPLVLAVTIAVYMYLFMKN